MKPTMTRAPRSAAWPWFLFVLITGVLAPAVVTRADPSGTKEVPPKTSGTSPEPSPVAPPPPPPSEPSGGSPVEPSAPATPEGSTETTPPPEVRKQIEQNRAAEAKAQELKASALAHPNDISYQVAYAQGLFDLGRVEEAIDVASALVEKFPRSLELTTILGRALARDGQFEIAAVQYQRALALDPANARTHYLAAGASLIRGDLKAAESGYRKALAIDPKLNEARDSLAILLTRAGRYRDANAVLAEGGKKSTGRFSLLAGFVKVPPFVVPESFQKVTIPFVTAKGYPPFVRIKVNEKIEKLFVVDTGSEETLLTPATAKALGLPEKGEDNVKDSEGREHVTPAYFVLDSFRIGDLLVKRIPARATPGLAYPDQQIGGSVGRDFLRRFRVILDYGAKTLTLARSGGAPLDGSPFDVAGVILVDGYRGDRAVGKFIIDTSSYTPGSMDILWVARETGLTVYSPGVTPVPEGPYLFKFTMPDLRVGEAAFENFSATAVDLRQMARKLGVNVRGVIGNSLLRLCRLEIDFENQRLSLRLAAAAPRPATPATPAASAPGGDEPGS